MNYDCIDGSTICEEEEIEFFSIQKLIDLANNFKECEFYFVGTNYSVGSLCSWRGSYDTPAITPVLEVKKGKQIAKELEEALKKTHHGYKGGQYKYMGEYEFYVADWGSSREHKVVDYSVEKGKVTLLTKLDPY